MLFKDILSGSRFFRVFSSAIQKISPPKGRHFFLFTTFFFVGSFEVWFVEHVSKGSGSAEIPETSVPLARNISGQDPWWEGNKRGDLKVELDFGLKQLQSCLPRNIVRVWDVYVTWLCCAVTLGWSFDGFAVSFLRRLRPANLIAMDPFPLSEKQWHVRFSIRVQP